MYVKFVVLVHSVVFVVSLCCVAFLPELPAPPHLLLLLVLLSLAVGICKHKAPRLIMPLLVFVSGFVYTSCYASYQLSLRLPDHLLGVETELIGTVVGLPFHNGKRLRFLCKIDYLRPLESDTASIQRGTLRLNWYGQDAPDLQAGNKIKIVVKLKPPNGFMNPGGFDNERWLLQKKIVATGYVRGKSFDVKQSVVSNRLTPVAALRNKIQRQLLLAGEGLQSQGIVLALAVGDRSGISREQWGNFIATGTNHLLAISGLHISLVAGFIALLVTNLWRYTGFASKATRQNSALIAALAAATCYAAMAGFTVPTMRALIMFAVLACLTLTRRHQRRLHSLSVALIVVCLCDPLTVLTPGFWMSFAAVAVLYIVFSDAERAGQLTTFKRVLRGHVLITIGLYPLTLLFFQQASLVSPLANLIVTPLVGMLVTPLVFTSALLALLSVPLASVLLAGVDVLLALTQWLLALFASWPAALMKVSGISTLALGLVCIGALLTLVPVPMSWRLIAFVLPLPLFYPYGASIPKGDYRVTFLDVGQGTSVVVSTAHHVLVYDTGDQFSGQFSAADAVVVPYLRSKNVKRLDKLIVSHADRDHSGGADELLDSFDVAELMLSAPLPQQPSVSFVKCFAGMSWVWDQVEFRILHPQPESLGSENDQSCVLQISTPDGLRTILTGDIEASGEGQLINKNQLEAVEVLLAPHHGSATSSGVRLIRSLQPKYVVYTTGFKNRFGFPKQEVLDRYQAHGANQLNTADSGAIEFLVSDNGPGTLVSEYRTEFRRWWHRTIAVAEAP